METTAEWVGGSFAALILLYFVYKAYNGGGSITTPWGTLYCGCGSQTNDEDDDISNRQAVAEITETITALSAHISRLVIQLTELQERQADLQTDAIDALRVDIAGSDVGSERGSDL